MSRIFLDYAAITPIDPMVAKEMEKVQKEIWANPSSLHHEGEKAKNVLEEARIKIARILHCRANEVFFTSGGTESLNLAILGISQGATLGKNAPKVAPWEIPHIITSTIEHPAVLEPIKYLLKNKKIEVSFITPNEKGIINPESIKKEIKQNTVLVVIQHANNEIGVIQPISKISKIIHEFKSHNTYPIIHTPYFLVDASQSALYENVSLEKLGADLLVLDGIKLYGPRGMGILVVKHGTNISPVFFGGGQERGLRSGTENVAGAVGLAKALEMAVQKRQKESGRLTKLRNYAISKILKNFPNVSLNGDLENRLPNNINICLGSVSQGDTLGKNAPKVSPWDSEFLVIKLDT
ncbi:MAG: cysteine desulfurase family protein, partial [Patescibacteria group bacterium]